MCNMSSSFPHTQEINKTDIFSKQEQPHFHQNLPDLCYIFLKCFHEQCYPTVLLLIIFRTSNSLSKTYSRGFPGGAVVENLPANAGDTGSSPGLGGSHMPWSNQAHEPQLLSLRVWSLCSATREAATERGPCTAMKSGPRLPQLQKALAQKGRPNIAINQSINKSLKK